MELFIAGGVGEHGRNCFLVQGASICFLVDCGKMADAPLDPYPHLTAAQIQRLDAIFLTHSHADHTGALPWLYENGFSGMVIGTEETLHQLPFPLQACTVLEDLCPAGAGHFGALSVQWGRSGHCVGSVWFRFSENDKSILFSGDYTEDTQVYLCDPIRNQYADLAVLDCAYGMDETSYATACHTLLRRTEQLRTAHPLLVFPVPKYGRGQEILQLFLRYLEDIPYYGDALFVQNIAAQNAGGFWYRRNSSVPSVPIYQEQKAGIVFLSDPQLRSAAARETVELVLSLGGRAVMTGTVEAGSYSAALLHRGKMELMRYPVHLNYAQFTRLAENNHFSAVVPYHSKEFSSEKELLF